MKLYRVSVWKNNNDRRSDFLYVDCKKAEEHFDSVVVASLSPYSNTEPYNLLTGYGVAINVYDTDEVYGDQVIPEIIKEFPSSDDEDYGRVIVNQKLNKNETASN